MSAQGGVQRGAQGAAQAQLTPEPSGFLRWLRKIWSPPDPELVDAGQRGEWLIAGVRLLIVVLILYFPLKTYFESHAQRGQTAILWLAVAALSEALIVYSAVRRSWGRGWIGFFSGIVDVSLVTLSLFIYLRLGQPLEVIGDALVFPVYFLAIGATSLRYDWRVCVLSGAAAVVQYLGLVYYTVWLWDLNNTSLSPLLAAQFRWTDQIGRVALLLMATFLAATVVVRAKEQRTLSNRDRLTGLANRGFFDESMNRIAAIASRSGEPVAVVMADVDHFKKFNDSYGHQSGDIALISVARVLTSAFRTTDLVARYGGEEFAGLFPGMNMEDALGRLEALRQKMESTPIHLDKGKVVRVTVSIGVAVYPDDGENLQQTLALADARLYKAKQAGRNRVVGFEAVPINLPPQPRRRSSDTHRADPPS